MLWIVGMASMHTVP